MISYQHNSHYCSTYCFYEGVWGGVQRTNDMMVKTDEMKMDEIFLLMIIWWEL